MALPRPAGRVVADRRVEPGREEDALGVIEVVALLEQRERDAPGSSTCFGVRRLGETSLRPSRVCRLEIRGQSVHVPTVERGHVAADGDRAPAVGAGELERLEPHQAAYDGRAVSGPLTEAECWWLLGGGTVGRVVLTLGAVPVVLPVNYMVADSTILFFTGAGIKRHAAVSGAWFGFEVDEIDLVAKTGWSVLAVGPGGELTDPADAHEARYKGLQSWAAGDRSHLIRITPEFLSGRRLHRATIALQDDIAIG